MNKGIAAENLALGIIWSIFLRASSKFGSQRVKFYSQNIDLSKLIYKARGRTLEIKAHKRRRYEDNLCVGCGEKDETEEETLLWRQDEYYNEVMDKVCESLELGADYEESYQSFKATQPDPELVK